MNLDWTPYAVDTKRTVAVKLHPTATMLQVIRGTSADAVDMSPYLENGQMSALEVSITLRWHLELYGAGQPTPGQILEVQLENKQCWVGVVQAINEYQLSSGRKSMTVVARSRNALPRWRDTRQATDVYPLSTPLNWIVSNIAGALGLDATDEVLIPQLGVYTMQNNIQMADLTPWQMLTTLMQPSGLEPFVDARGRLKTINRDTTRASDVVLTDNRRLININGSKARATVTEVKIRWLDPMLREVSQQSQNLAAATITAGFFKLTQNKDIAFSRDGTQRARDTYMVVKASANAGLLNFCTERYSQKSITTGLITVRTSIFAPALATIALLTSIQAGYIPDGVAGTVTIPIGKIVHAVSNGALLLIMMSVGTGQYEIWGTPYDMVHTRNSTTAYNPAAKDWEVNVLEIESDFVVNEAAALNFATRELIYNFRSASSYNITIVDDLRIEPGDIVELSDGSRVYVTEYSRELTSGSPAMLKLTGFRV